MFRSPDWKIRRASGLYVPLAAMCLRSACAIERSLVVFGSVDVGADFFVRCRVRQRWMLCFFQLRDSTRGRRARGALIALFGPSSVYFFCALAKGSFFLARFDRDCAFPDPFDWMDPVHLVDLSAAPARPFQCFFRGFADVASATISASSVTSAVASATLAGVAAVVLTHSCCFRFPCAQCNARKRSDSAPWQRRAAIWMFCFGGLLLSPARPFQFPLLPVPLRRRLWRASQLWC